MGAGIHRTEMELGYGVVAGEGLARSVMGMTKLPGGTMYRLGGEFYSQDRFTVSMFGVVHTHAAARGELGLNVRASLQY